MTDEADPAGAAALGDEAPSAQRQVQDLQVILGVARALAAATELPELLALLLDSLRTLLHADRATVFLYDPATHALYSTIAHGTDAIRFPADQGIAGAALRDRRIINIPDAYQDPRFNAAVDHQTGYQTRCLLTVPLTGFDGEVVGVVQALNKTGGVFSRYDERLAEAIAAQVGVAIQRARLLDHWVHKKQLESSLALARSIQQNLLPRQPPQVAGYDVAGWCCPADATGGDYYDFLLLPERLVVTVADATGHGIGPALEIAETRALVRAIAHSHPDVREILAQVNRWLINDLTEGRFVTAFLGMLDPVRHTLTHASAGHGPLFWYRAAERAVRLTAATALPLGVMEPLAVEAGLPFHFASGDLGLFLTDGFLEAESPDGNFFGKDRVVATIVEHAQRPAADLIAALETAVRTFLGSGPALDDRTAVVVKRCE